MNPWSCTTLLIVTSFLPAQSGQATIRSARIASARLDKIVSARLHELKLTQAPTCRDDVFLRRAHLDLTGTLPPIETTRRFLASKDPDKRASLIDALLTSREYADYMAMRWGDILRIKSEFPINLWPNAAQAYHDWVWQSFRHDKPYDQFCRELLVSNGSNFRVPPVNFYRAVQNKNPMTIASVVALTFMGVRLDGWPDSKRRDLARFFAKIRFKPSSEWKEEIVFFDARMAIAEKRKSSNSLRFPDGKTIELALDRDPREAFADWLLKAKNPWFARAAVNRAWGWCMGRGVIHPVDDIRPDNDPAHPKLLRLLEREFVSCRFDWKQLFRIIMLSSTYQQDSRPVDNRQGAREFFACYPTRRLEAEVIVDAICRITGMGERYMSMIPEPFTFIPPETPAIRLPDGSISSATLDMFGRPPRDTGLDSERNNQPTPTQRLYLLNSSQILQRIERGTLLRKIQTTRRGKFKESVAALYLHILSRYPTTEELGIVYGMAGKQRRNRRILLVDLAWALLNTAEFQYRH